MKAEALLHAELQKRKNELQRLRERMSVGTPTIHKDLYLISLLPKWSDSDSTVTLEEFFSSVEASARFGRWGDNDQREIVILRLTGSAKLFYHGCTELHEEGTAWQTFKSAFRRRYKDIHTDQYHFTKLQTARQGKNESPQEFADRYRALAQKINANANDPPIQRVHRENAERMLLASFILGLAGVPGRQVSYANPRDLNEALTIARSVQEAEKQERFNKTFYTRLDKSVRLTSRSPSRAHSGNGSQQHLRDSRAVNHTRSQQNRIGQVPTCLKPRALGTHRSTLRYVMTVKALGISLGSTQPGLKKRQKPLTRREGIRPNV